MELDFFEMPEDGLAHPPPALRLISVYAMTADESYRITHPPMGGRQILVATLDGEGELWVKGKTTRLRAGQYMLLSPNEPFRYRCAGELWEFWWFEFLGDSPGPQPDTVHYIPLYSKGSLIALGNSCLSFLRVGRYECASAAFGALYCTLCLSGDENGAENGAVGVFSRILRHIHTHLGNAGIDEICVQFGISERTLRNLFSRNLQTSPKRYIQNARLENARYFLQNTGKRVGEIAAELGYSSQFHLSKAFSEKYGLSPLQYRKQHAVGAGL